MTRKIKELFFKYIKSNLMRCGIIVLAKIVYHIIQLLPNLTRKQRIIGPVKIRNKPTKQRCKQNNKSRYQKIYDAYRANKKDPKTMHHTIHPNFIQYRNETQYEQFVARIPQGKILGDYTVLTPDNKILWDSCAYLDANLYSNPSTYKLRTQRFQKHKETIAIIAGNDTYKNYNHRMTFGLPKFHLFQQAGVTIDKYYVNTNTSFHQECLQKLGITSSQIISVDTKTHIQTDKLLVASTTTISGNIPTRAVHFIRNLFLKDKENTNKFGKKRIYISRIHNRKVSNEKEIFAMLEKKGFEKYILENMSIQQQADLFAQTEIVIAPHGAGLTNIIFCNPGTKVIELFQPKTVRGHYYCLANTCNLDYYYLIGSRIKHNDQIPMDQDMHIPLDQLQQTLQLATIDYSKDG